MLSGHNFHEIIIHFGYNCLAVLWIFYFLSITSLRYGLAEGYQGLTVLIGCTRFPVKTFFWEFHRIECALTDEIGQSTFYRRFGRGVGQADPLPEKQRRIPQNQRRFVGAANSKLLPAQ